MGFSIMAACAAGWWYTSRIYLWFYFLDFLSSCNEVVKWILILRFTYLMKSSKYYKCRYIICSEYVLLDKKNIQNLPIYAFKIRIWSSFSIQIIYSCYIHHNIYRIHFPSWNIQKYLRIVALFIRSTWVSSKHRTSICNIYPQ